MYVPDLLRKLLKGAPLCSLAVLCAALRPAIGQAQLHDIDSLRTLLATRTIEDSTTAGTLYQLSRSYWIRDLDSAETVAMRLMGLSDRIAYRQGMGDAWNSLGVVRWYRGDYPGAMVAHQKALEIRTALGRSAMIAASFHNIGLLHDDQGNYPEAIANYLKALKYYEQVGDRQGAAQEHNAIANVLTYQGQHLPALAEHRKALAIRAAEGDLWDLSETYSNLGLVHADLGQLDSAEHYHDLALAIRVRTDDQQGIAVSYNNLGDLYLQLGRHAEARVALEQALAINARAGYRKSMASSHLSLGALDAALGREAAAMRHLRTALELAEEVGSLDMAHATLRALSETAARFGDHAAAYRYRLRYEAITDSIYNAERTRSLVRQQMEYAFAKQQLADSLAAAEVLDRSRAAHALELATERNRQLLIGMGALLVLVLAFALWSRLRYMRRARDTILRTQEQLVRSEKEREAEQVRTRIARDIHDEIGGELTRIRLLGSEARHLMDHDAREAANAVERMARSAKAATSALRDIVWSTDPGHDRLMALADHLRDSAPRLVDGSGVVLALDVHMGGPDRVITPAWKADILRMVKEAVNNALKYAEAHTLTLSFHATADRFFLSIADDGRGFDPDQVVDGNGLRNLRARAASINASFTLTTAPGKGCTLAIAGPLPVLHGPDAPGAGDLG